MADCNAAYTLLASLELRGPDCLKILERVHRRLKPQTYVEIGVFTGRAMHNPDSRLLPGR